MRLLKGAKALRNPLISNEVRQVRSACPPVSHEGRKIQCSVGANIPDESKGKGAPARAGAATSAAERHANEFIVMVMVRASWHIAADLVVPVNMRLVYLPRYSRETSGVIPPLWPEGP